MKTKKISKILILFTAIIFIALLFSPTGAFGQTRGKAKKEARTTTTSANDMLVQQISEAFVLSTVRTDVVPQLVISRVGPSTFAFAKIYPEELGRFLDSLMKGTRFKLDTQGGQISQFILIPILEKPLEPKQLELYTNAVLNFQDLLEAKQNAQNISELFVTSLQSKGVKIESSTTVASRDQENIWLTSYRNYFIFYPGEDFNPVASIPKALLYESLGLKADSEITRSTIYATSIDEIGQTVVLGEKKEIQTLDGLQMMGTQPTVEAAPSPIPLSNETISNNRDEEIEAAPSPIPLSNEILRY